MRLTKKAILFLVMSGVQAWFSLIIFVWAVYELPLKGIIVVSVCLIAILVSPVVIWGTVGRRVVVLDGRPPYHGREK